MPYYLDRPIQIDEYDPHWPVLYEQERRILVAELGRLLKAVEHIGSTAVPDLGAKHIIDILAGVSDLDEVSEHVAALERLGYEDALINPVFLRRLFCKGGYNEGSHHLHFVVFGSDPWLLPLQFRDYLRTHSDTRIQYGELKHQLAHKHLRDLDGYSEGKGEFIQTILAASR